MSEKSSTKIYSKSALHYTVMIFMLLILVGFYLFTEYQKLSAVKAALNQAQGTLVLLQSNTNNTSKEYLERKKDFDKDFSKVLTTLKNVFPEKENYTDLTRAFDKFFQESNTAANPVLMSDLKYGTARRDEEKGYAILPVTMTISGTQENFLKFLRFIENSGVLEDGTRLMDVRSISINFVEAPQQKSTQNLQSAPRNINVSLDLNAYFHG